MGMAASQARLLSITARLTNNENTGQSISYSKQRLADQTQQITNEYNEALDATKLTVLTGFNGAEANYTDISYNLMTGLQMAENVKQYVVTDTKGRILVNENIADAYEKSRGNYNQFLANLGYSQADISVQKTYTDINDRTEEQAKAEQKIHEAWDKYFATIGVNLGDNEHDFGFSWTETVVPGGDVNNQNDYAIGQGYAGYVRTDENGDYVDKDGNPAYFTNEQGEFLDKAGNVIAKDEYSDDVKNNADNVQKYVDENGDIIDYDVDTDDDGVMDAYSNDVTTNEDNTLRYFDKNGDLIDYDDYSEDAKSKRIVDSSKIVYDPINYEGTTDEQRELFDYAMALTEAYLRVNNDGTTQQYHLEYNQGLLASTTDPENVSTINYYNNIFDKMQSSGYFTYTNTPAKADDTHIYAGIGTGTAGNVQKSPLEDNAVFEQALRDGTLRLEYYSTTDKSFKSTTISEDSCIQEVADERAIAKAESKYNQDMTDLENKDKKLDLELKKLDTEHSALQTEYDSVKNVVDKNVEASFKTFG